MKLSSPKFSLLRNSLIFSLSVLVVMGIHMSFSARAQNALDTPNFYGNYLEDYEGMAAKYHIETNKLFNERIQKLVAIANKGNDDDLRKLVGILTPPAFEKNENGENVKRLPCSGKDKTQNLSTFCLSLAVSENYFQFRAAMIEAQRHQKTKIAENLSANLDDDAVTLSDVLNRVNINEGSVGVNISPSSPADVRDVQEGLRDYRDTVTAISRELELAEKALDQGLAAYNELQMALPLHIKYVQMIKMLETYRDKVANIRSEVHVFPQTFLDVTTTSCT